MAHIYPALFQDIKEADYAVTVGVCEKWQGKVDADYLKLLLHAPKESLKTLIDDYLEIWSKTTRAGSPKSRRDG
jgi:hypothetical protein